MNARRWMIATTTLLGLVAGMSLAACGGPEDEEAQPATAVADDSNPGSGTQAWSANGVKVTYSESGTGYNLGWSNLYDSNDGDYNNGGGFVYGRGWNPSKDLPVYYEGSWNNTCGGCFGIYGWTTGTLVEYYICDSTGALEGPHNSSAETGIKHRCAFVSDGDVYDVYYNVRKNQPCITGNSCTFPQYISVRRTPRTSGTITVKNHFDQWATKACGTMTLGNREKMVLATEAWARPSCASSAPGISGSSSVKTLVQLGSPYSAAPAQPGSFKARTWGYGGLQLSWNAVSGAAQYEITRAEFGNYYYGNNVTQFTTTDTTYSDWVPNWGSKYQYSVVAKNSSGIAGPSPKAVTILGAPTVTTSFSGSGTSEKITLTWTAVTGATKYVVQDGANSGVADTDVGTTKSFSKTLGSGTWYVYMVKASDGVTLGTAGMVMGYTP
jgi:endo-1,4-beta-xylanase